MVKEFPSPSVLTARLFVEKRQFLDLVVIERPIRVSFRFVPCEDRKFTHPVERFADF
jgi:hypothetical protein